MLSADGSPKTSHSLNPVAAVLVGPAFEKFAVRPQGRLADVAPTILQVLEIEQPLEMDGQSLLVEK